MISFNNVSPSYRASNNFIELAGVKKSFADLFIPPTGLLVGMFDPAKTAVVDYEVEQVVSADDVGLKYGFGSHIHRQASKLPPAVFLQGGGVWALPIPEESGGTAADETITISGTATSSGTLYFSIGGDIVQVGVSSGDAAADVAAALDVAITAERDIAVTSGVLSAVVTVTAKFKGTPGNDILVVENPAGSSQEKLNPSGITVALENVDGYLDGGATDPDLEDAFFDSSGNDILGDRWYTVIGMPFVDATNLAHYKELADQRADPAVNRFFGSYAGYVDKTYSEALALPATFNKEYIGQLFEDDYYCPSFELSAELMGIILDEQAFAPNRPYKTVEMSGLFNPAKNNRLPDKNDALYRAGMSYCKVVSNSLKLGDIALTYRTNDSGGSATDWYDAVSLHRRQAKAYSIEELFRTEKYARSVVVDNNVVTQVDFAIAPKDIIADMTKLILDLWAPYAWTKNADDVISSLAAEINSTYESRIDGEVVDDEAQALRIIAMKYAFLY